MFNCGPPNCSLGRAGCHGRNTERGRRRKRREKTCTSWNARLRQCGPFTQLASCSKCIHLPPFSQCFKLTYSTVWLEYFNLVSQMACPVMNLVARIEPEWFPTEHVCILKPAMLRVSQEGKTVRNLAVTSLLLWSRWLSPVTSNVNVNYPLCSSKCAGKATSPLCVLPLNP